MATPLTITLDRRTLTPIRTTGDPVDAAAMAEALLPVLGRTGLLDRILARAREIEDSPTVPCPAVPGAG